MFKYVATCCDIVMKHKRTGQTYTGIWMPIKLKQELVTAVRDNSDLSKFIRSAVREKLSRTRQQEVVK